MTYENCTNDKEFVARKSLENYVKDWKIFMDTCSILRIEEGGEGESFWTHIIPLLQQYQNKIIIPLKVIEELEKHTTNAEKPELAQNAKSALKKLHQLLSAELIEIRGEQGDNFADNVFLVVFTKFRMTHKLLLITQDGNLAKDMVGLNASKAVKANSVHVKRINRYGFLSNFNWNDDEGKQEVIVPNKRIEVPNSRQQQEAIVDADEDEQSFQVCNKVTSVQDTPMKVSYIPTENDLVYTPYGPIKLEKKFASGGEGFLYETNTPYVAKIYKKENNTRRKYEKIKLMLSKKITYEGICFPIVALYNAEKEFIGYLMPKAKGKELQKSIFIKPLFQKNFPDWKKRDTVELCITILNKIKYLHDRNIIMGDINPSNILVVSPTEVYFVDTDSYQIEDFPCPVGTNNYTAPEIQRKHFSDFLRTEGNENFAVATLLFMIMLPGKPPYSQQGGEDPINNIIKMDFSYPFGDNSNKKTPDGPWRYIWSHLPYDLKEAFYHTFRQGGQHSEEKDRLTVNEWIPIFTYYLELLDSGKFGEQDEMSEELFPCRHKKNRNFEYITCKLCGKEITESQGKNGICRDCLNNGDIYHCKKCGKEILYSNYQKYVKNAPRFDRCKECFEYDSKVRLKQICVDCKQPFEITNSQYDYYASKGLALPKRCRACREAKKNRSAAISGSFSSTNYTPPSIRYTPPQSTYTSPSTSYTPKQSTYTPPRPSNPAAPKTNSSKSKGSFCFISTVVCDYLGKDDNCAELQMLRNYRDSWLRNQPDGQKLIAEYYNQAPLLVSKLQLSQDYETHCQYLWDHYLNPCFKLIEDEDFDECKNLYMAMYQYLKLALQ